MRRKRFIQLCVRSTTQHHARKPLAFDGLGFFAPTDVAREAELGQGTRTSW